MIINESSIKFDNRRLKGLRESKYKFKFEKIFCKFFFFVIT